MVDIAMAVMVMVIFAAARRAAAGGDGVTGEGRTDIFF